MAPPWVRVCAAAEVPDEGALRVEVDGTPVCVARSAGRLYALYDVCSHAEVALSEGDVSDGTVECWLHGSRFDLATGKPLSLPATEPVPVYPVRHDGDDVLIALPHDDARTLASPRGPRTEEHQAT